jgi:hypothetical protein
MTKAQASLYWREWGKVRKAAPETDRHELHVRALGADRSHKEFTNGDLDQVLAEFRVVSEPWNLNAQMRQLNQPRKRLMWSIRNRADQPYWEKIMRDRFSKERLEDLTDRELEQLRNTLAARANKKRIREAVDTV